ncbi:MAG: biotin-dependent carboxyltransferase family protein, partial [Vulcanimicrobiaceae bacterium]
MSARICVIAPGLATAVQDAGRRGYEHLGCMVGGWLDDESARAANQLVGNLPTDALLEIALIGPTLEFPDGGWAALTGADLGCTIDGEPWPPGGSRRLPAGARVAFGSALRGLRAYLAVAGGIDVASILESRATDLVAGFGGFHGRLLRAGDDLTFAAAAAPFATLVSAPLRTGPVVRVLPGPACDDFRAGALDDFLTTPFRVGLDSDRVGLRLDGA